MQSDSILLVGSTDKSRALLQTLIPPDTFGTVKICSTSAEARREATSGDYAAVVINTPLSDESGLDLAADLAQNTVAGIILLVKAELADSVAAHTEKTGTLVVAKPVSRALFMQALTFSLAARHRLIALHQENQKLQKKLQELKIVDRAKCALIQYLGMTEDQAHRHIEKEAMDTRQTRAAVARSILASYEM